MENNKDQKPIVKTKNDDLKQKFGYKTDEFYKTIRIQLNFLFWANLGSCIIATAIIIIGIFKLIQGDITSGIVMTVASILTQAISLLFSSQYLKVFQLTGDNYSKTLAFDSMYKVTELSLDIV